MTNTLLKLLALVVVMFSIGNSSTNVYSSKNEKIVKSYIKARNNYNIKKINTLIDKNYNETFIDGSTEIKNKEHLIDAVLWGKELDANINLLDIKSDGETVITTEEMSNYLDVALQRKSRKFKITYTLLNNNIQHQKIDTLAGYHKVLKSNSIQYQKFLKYCEQNLLNCSSSFNQESGIELRKMLKKYKTENN